MTIKKKPLIIAIAIILALIATTITLFLVFGKERVNVKIVELPKEVGELEMKRMNYHEFVETKERMDEILTGQYIKKEDQVNRKDELLKKLNRSETFKSYNEEFFGDNFLLFVTTHVKYGGWLSLVPDIKEKSTTVNGEEKLVVTVEIVNDPVFNPGDYISAIQVAEAPYGPHGFIIEIPRKQFEKYNMTYDDIEIVYLNSHDTRYNVQYGGDKYRLDPNYPQPIGFDYSKLKD